MFVLVIMRLVPTVDVSPHVERGPGRRVRLELYVGSTASSIVTIGAEANSCRLSLSRHL